jgi:tRNA (guanine-N(7)-)-methyltransferase subunit TRM82
MSLSKDIMFYIMSPCGADAYSSYPIDPPPNEFLAKDPKSVNPQDRRLGVASHENPIPGSVLILGHASHLSSMVLSRDDGEQYIITADRDEHVRVSWYPQGWNVERFCLGHEK